MGVLTLNPRHPVLDNLSTFLSRLFLVAPQVRETQAIHLISRAVRRYYSASQGTFEFFCYLYRLVFATLHLHDLVFPSAVPAGPGGAWFSGLPADEQDFLRRCMSYLPQPDLLILYLHFYARLTAEQIACVYRAEDPNWTADHVVARVEAAWGMVLS